MKKRFAVGLILSLAMLGARTASAQPNSVTLRSPGPGMHFTEGLPVVVFLDILTGGGSGLGSIVNGVGWPQGQVLIDGTAWKDSDTQSITIAGPNMLNNDQNAVPVDYYRLSANGVAAGTHQLVGRGLFYMQPNVDASPVSITVDAWPANKTQVMVASDTTMADLNWDNVAVRGNGSTLTLSGNVTIKNSLITGFSQITTGDGSVGTLDIENSIFEDTGPLTVTPSGAVTMTNNEFRANNRLTFVTDDPSVPAMIAFKGGDDASTKVFQGNRVGAGIVTFYITSHWLIGGDTDATSNVLIGPRCVLQMDDCSNMTLRGNYDHHNYIGGWSQGLDFDFGIPATTSDGVLAEHNVIRGGSWPVQGVGGEFRYNLVYGYGHDWIRTASTGADIHHNVFVPEAAGQFGGGLSFYAGETGLQIYNNTFDCGGNVTGDCSSSPLTSGTFVNLAGSSQVASLRNNLFTYGRNQNNSGPGTPAITAVDTSSYAYADYNAFYSPDNDNKVAYDITIAGKTVGQPGFAGHDVSGVGALGVKDGQLAASPFAGTRIFPYETVVDESAVWQGTQGVSKVLAAFRVPYTPKAGSPIVNAGDIQDNDAENRRTDIGAIDLDGHDQDKFGKFGTPCADCVPPTVTLISPMDGATVTKTIMLTAMAEDNVGGSGVALVAFLVDGSAVGQTAMTPYSIAFDTSVVSNADHVVAAKAWDKEGNSAISPSVTIHVTGNTPPPTGAGGASSTNGTGNGSGGNGTGNGSGGNGTSNGSGGKGGATPAGDSGSTGGCGCSFPVDGTPPASIALMTLFALAMTRRRSHAQ